MRSFGLAANQWAKHVQDSEAVCVASPDGFAAAVSYVIEQREGGRRCSVLILVPNARSVVFDAIYSQLARGKSSDVHYRLLTAFTNGNVQLDGRSQRDVEATIFDAIRQHYRDLWALADVVLFRSEHERALATVQFGSTPTRSGIFCPLSARVPVAAAEAKPTHGGIVLWTSGASGSVEEAVRVTLSDLPMPVVCVPDSDDAGTADILASASVIVSLSDDPGVALALSAYGRPLCAAALGADELLWNVPVFLPFDPVGTVDAVLRALAAGRPAVRSSSPPVSPPEPAPQPPLASHPLVTIVVTVYDRLAALEQTLNALSMQTYPNIEIIVVSNDGPDASAVCGRFANVKYIHRSENTGTPAAPRNDGIAAAAGEYITCIDDDDGYFPDHIERMVRICEGGAKCVYSDFVIKVVETGERGEERLIGYDLERGDGITAMSLMVINRIGYMTVFAHREIYERLGAYDDDEMQGAGEVELWLRIAQKYAMAHSDQASSYYTIRQRWQGSLTAQYHTRYAGGFENMYRRYPADGLPAIEEERSRNLAELRSNAVAPPRHARYPAAI
ncbi:MAG TPA: glycosyltransferase family 2 protein [Candidatus Aquilonibacter sp.]|nr:glycosyltransferase family 2 protein [Candidatus Aquilonibacter sp.]